MRTLLVFSALVSAAVAQSFTVPSSWREPTTSHSQDELAKIAQAADDSWKSLYNSSTGLFSTDTTFDTDATTFSALARKDRFAGTQNNKWMVGAIKTVNQLFPGFVFSTTTYHPIFWGIAAIDGYKAYKDSGLLQLAYDAFDYSVKYQISEAQAQAGRHPAKTYQFVSTCNGNTIAGALFVNTSSVGNMNIYMITPGHFAVFAALLADVEASEGRDNTKYKNAAVLTGNFILNQMVDTDSSLALNLLAINGTDACTHNPTTWSRNTGNVIESFAVLADLTGDSKWTNALSKVVAGATTTAAWTGNDGVVTEASQSTDVYDRALKGRYMASFYEAWARSKNSDFKSYINAYVNVQNNALLDLATANNLGFYSSNWHGPAATSFAPDGMVAAVDLTALAVATNSQTTSVSSSSSGFTSRTSSRTSSSTAPASTETHKDSSLAVPLGAGLGAGIPVLLLLLLGAVFLCRRRRNREPSTSPELGNEKYTSPTQEHPELHTSPFVPPTNAQPETTFYSPVPTSAPLPMPEPQPASAPTPPPGRIEFATAPSGKETLFTWQGQPQTQQPQAGVSSGSGVNQTPGEELPTADLVRILNDRVSRGYEVQGDGPPVYQEAPR